MLFVESPTELSTSATDLVIAVESIVIMVCLWRTDTKDRWRAGLWCGVFFLLAIASFLGATAHGLKLSDTLRVALWMPLYLSLGILVSLFLVGAIYDWRGYSVARRFLPWSIVAGISTFVLTQVFNGAFIVFVLYESVVMLAALAIYFYLAATRQIKGATVLAIAVLLNIVAAGIQASDVSIHVLFQFDHNGVFHLVQIVATALLGLGVSMGLRNAKEAVIEN